MIAAFLMSTAIASQACEPPAQQAYPKATTTVEMLEDRTIVLHAVDPRNPDYPVERLKPGSTNYAAIQKMIEGISPGEVKTMPEFIGQVDMAKDRTLTYSFWGIADNGASLNGRETAHPEDPNYDKILALVGHLERKSRPDV